MIQLLIGNPLRMDMAFVDSPAAARTHEPIILVFEPIISLI